MSKLFYVNSSATFKVPTSKMVGTMSIPKKTSTTNLTEMEPGDNKPPDWVDDKDSDSCMICYDKFSLTKRRHHCRSCGRLVCASCSPNKAKLKDDKKAERVCDSCFEQVEEPDTLCKYTGCTSPKLNIPSGRGYCLAHHKDAEKKADDPAVAREKAKDVYTYFCKVKPTQDVMTKTRFLRCATDLKLIHDGKDGLKAVTAPELQRWFGVDEEADGDEELVDYKQFYKGLAEYTRRIHMDMLKNSNDECVSFLIQRFKQSKTLDHLTLF